MKDKVYVDFGQIMDEIFEATKNFGETIKDGFKCGPNHFYNENFDFYPAHMYPPANVYLTKQKDMVFEFALAGFKEEDIDLKFQGDHMILTAKAPKDEEDKSGRRYFKKRLKLKDIEDQKFYVPESKFNRENVKAVYKSGLLKVTIPAKESFETEDGVKIEIVREAE